MGNRYFVTSFLFVLTVFVIIIVITIATLSVLLASQFPAMKASSEKTGEYFSPAYAQTSEDFLIPGNPISTQLPGNPSSLSFPSSSSTTTTVSPSSPSTIINNSNTFYTKGLLSTVLTPSSSYLKNHLPDAILNQQRQQQDNTGENQTIQTNLFYMYPKLVSGVWSLNVSVGLVTDFHANFKLITINGIDKHFVELLNFQNVNGSPVKFNQFSNTPINGFVDVKIDNEIFMTKVPVIIKLFKINTISVVIKNELVDNIFYDNDILGITDSFKNFKNDELLILEGDDEN